MDPQSTFLPVRRRTPRKRRQPATSATPIALNLVSATYEDGYAITLTFDRPIDIAGLDGSAITVDDGALSNTRWTAEGAVTLMTPITVQIELVEAGPSTQPLVLLDAGAGNGIVAGDDGAAWAGASDVELPFP